MVSLAAAVLLCSSLLSAQTGRRAPGFSLPDVNNQQHDLQDYRGKVVIIDIMRTECPECRPFAKTLERIKTRYGGKVAILAITNPPDSPASVGKFIAQEKITYPILFDCGQVTFSFVLPNPLKPSVKIPHAYVIDRAGVIRGDYEFGDATKDKFLGDGLFPELDRLAAGKTEGKR